MHEQTVGQLNTARDSQMRVCVCVKEVSMQVRVREVCALCEFRVCEGGMCANEALPEVNVSAVGYCKKSISHVQSSQPRCQLFQQREFSKLPFHCCNPFCGRFLRACLAPLRKCSADRVSSRAVVKRPSPPHDTAHPAINVTKRVPRRHAASAFLHVASWQRRTCRSGSRVCLQM